VPIVETAPPVVLATMSFQEQYIKIAKEMSLINNQKIHFQLKNRIFWLMVGIDYQVRCKKKKSRIITKT
jgi:hypothetical protein